MAELKTVLYPVSDLDAAKAVYNALLGVMPTVDESYYVGYQLPDVQVGLVPGGHEEQQLVGGVAHWHVEDMAATVAALTAAGGAVVTEPHEVGWGRLTALVTDADGNQIGLIQDARP